MRQQHQPQRQVLTPVSDETHIWILEQGMIHGLRYRKALSAARITRAILAGLAAAGAPIGAQRDGEAIEKYVAGVFTRHATEAAQRA